MPKEACPLTPGIRGRAVDASHSDGDGKDHPGHRCAILEADPPASILVPGGQPETVRSVLPVGGVNGDGLTTVPRLLTR